MLPKLEPIYIERDAEGETVLDFSHIQVVTDEGSFRLGEPCPDCSAPIVARTVKRKDQYHSFPWCGNCGKSGDK